MERDRKMTKRGTEGPHREGQKDDKARNRRSGC